MTHYKYLIIGGGMTADAAAGAIREADSQGSLGLISAETYRPYNRPPLSKGLWTGSPLDSVWRAPEPQSLDLHLGRRATSLDPETRRVRDDRGTEYAFDELLLATGGRPRRLPSDPEGVIYFRTLDDYKRLRSLSEHGESFAVIGGGFIGSEIAAALAMNGKRVTMIFPGTGVCARAFPPELSRHVTETYRGKGVEVLAGERIASVERRGDEHLVRTVGGREVTVDGVVAGLGIEPNVQLAVEAGLEVRDGILVDKYLCSSHPRIHAAGDVARFFNPALGTRIRVEHEDAANTMGRAAGLAMAGQPEPYDHLPSFYSDLFQIGYEAVGVLDSHLETVADWKEPLREGVVYYVDRGRVRGVLLWNVWGQVEAARALIAEPGPFQAADVKGRVPWTKPH